MKTKMCRTCKQSFPLSGFGFHAKGHSSWRADCKACRAKKTKEHNHLIGLKRPIEMATDLPVWLGIHVAERVLSKYFDNVVRMPYGNPGYDYICSKGYKIDVKCSCLSHGNANFPLPSGRWTFAINRNNIADYFLCLGFDNRMDLNPMHIWLVPGKLVSDKKQLRIGNKTISFANWSSYERSLDKVIGCCNILRGIA